MLLPTYAAQTLTEAVDTVLVLPELEVCEARDAVSAALRTQPGQVVAFNTAQLEHFVLNSPKDLSAFVPGLTMPEYGSAATSTIYVRGLGSRIDEPVMGIVTDGVPLLDKNMYDRRFQDVRRIEVMRGPQATFYGRNTMGGVIEIHSLFPLDEAAPQVTASLGYGAANTVEASAAFFRRETPHFGWSLSARFDRTDGFFVNDYTHTHVDSGYTAGARLSLEGRTGGWHLRYALTMDRVDQGAFPYAAADTKRIDYNDRGAYARWTVLNMFSARKQWSRADLLLTASYQYLSDRMDMDNDYTSRSIFTLSQVQRMNGATVDALVRGKQLPQWFDYQVGFSSFVKHSTLAAPVTFLRGGIDELILANANRGISKAFPGDSLEITEQQFVITDDFIRVNIGAAIYGQTQFRPLPNFSVRLGLRLDVEHAAMDYYAGTSMHYRMTALMAEPRLFGSTMQGRLQRTFFQFLPRLSLQYDFPDATLYASAAKGSKAGGFNPQIFSTIIQNRLMGDMMSDMGVHLDGMGDERYTRAEITEYQPETAWTTEVGTHWTPLSGLKIDMDAFFIHVNNMQLTVFPPGKTTGRMMTNAARALSAGAEAALNYLWALDRWSGMLHANYAYTHAKFISFHDGQNDYSGNHVPYAPVHSANIAASFSYHLQRPWLNAVTLNISANGQGPLFWNEDNSLSQPFYACLGGSLELKWRYFNLNLWAQNITNTSYDVFYFVSMSRHFLQPAKPVRFGLRLTFEY